MNDANGYYQKIKDELNFVFSKHPSLKKELIEKLLPYASFFVPFKELIKTKNFCYLGTAICLLAGSFLKHFKGPVKEVEILKGDFFYSQALSLTIKAGNPEAIKVLSRAVIDEISFQEKKSSPHFYSLLLASAKLVLLDEKKELKDISNGEIMNKVKKIIESKEVKKHFVTAKIMEDITYLLEGD